MRNPLDPVAAADVSAATTADPRRSMSSGVCRRHRFRAVALVTILLSAGAAHDATPASPDWHDVKCTRYGRAWLAALSHFGTTGLGQDFLDRHAAFIASNCTTKADVCPRSPAEFKLANVMVMLSMNAGTASTFPPFACPK